MSLTFYLEKNVLPLSPLSCSLTDRLIIHSCSIRSYMCYYIREHITCHNSLGREKVVLFTLPRIEKSILKLIIGRVKVEQHPNFCKRQCGMNLLLLSHENIFVAIIYLFGEDCLKILLKNKNYIFSSFRLFSNLIITLSYTLLLYHIDACIYVHTHKLLCGFTEIMQ